ncbi:MAG: ATP-binding protein [Clostridia bacterium]
MKSEIYSKIKREFDAKRANALSEAENRLEDVRKNVIGFVDVEKEIAQISITALQAVLKKPEEAEQIATELTKQTDEKIIRKLKLLENAGYAKDYLEPRFECQICDDTSIVKGAVGDAICTCFKQKLLENMFHESGLIKGKTAQFDQFNLDIFIDEKDPARFSIKNSPREQIKIIKERCLSYIESDFKELGAKCLLFFGNTGTGKTFMAQSIANEILLLGFTVAYVSAPLMFDKINEARMTFGEDEYEDYFAGLKDAELLVIDDLGTETFTDAKMSNLLQLLNARESLDLVSPHKTIISTNLNLQGLQNRYDERIYSRIIGRFIICQFGGEDLRIVTK